MVEGLKIKLKKIFKKLNFKITIHFNTCVDHEQVYSND